VLSLCSFPPAEHIQKQLERGYAVKDDVSQTFAPTPLGESLISSYRRMGLDNLWKPDLRGRIEQGISRIAAGQVRDPTLCHLYARCGVATHRASAPCRPLGPIGSQALHAACVSLWHEPGLCCCAVILVCCMQVTKDVILQQAIQAFRSDFQAAMQRTQVRHTRAGSTNRPPPSLIWQTCNST
jgi:hypothetical protein